MEYFWSDGGNNRPDFTYRFTLKEVTEEMYDWCGNYPLDGPFVGFADNATVFVMLHGLVTIPENPQKSPWLTAIFSVINDP